MAILKTTYGSTGTVVYEQIDSVALLGGAERIIRIYGDGIQEREMSKGDRVEILKDGACIHAEDCEDVTISHDELCSAAAEYGCLASEHCVAADNTLNAIDKSLKEKKAEKMSSLYRQLQEYLKEYRESIGDKAFNSSLIYKKFIDKLGEIKAFEQQG